jgi:CTP-dependent riboflavin kinase
MIINGVVRFRSSRIDAPDGPPGEAAVLALNPQRRDAILKVTGWPNLEPGTLNLEVAKGVVDSLLDFKPSLIESGDSIVYPVPYQSIPKMRGEYYYFTAIGIAHGISRDVLVRRAKTAIPRRLELFAATSLKNDLTVGDGDTVSVKVTAQLKS